jgi:cytoskeleton protein RodZ
MTAVENPQPVVEAPASPGRRLADARTAQNLSQADVARQLKLSLWQVEALEAGRHQQLPGPIFVRGFIRNYARLVKLDPDSLVQSLGDSAPASTPRPEAPPSRDIPFPAKEKPRWARFVAPAALVVCLLAVYEFYWNEPDDAPASPAPTATAPKAHKAAPKPDAAVIATESGAPGVGGTQTGSAAPAEAPAASHGKDTKPIAGTAAEAKPAPAPKRGERQVKLAFNQECWVEIRDRNEKIIFSQLNRPGTQQSISGLPPFSVILGNAHGVQLTYDDKPVDLAPHTKIDVARLILP